MAEEQHRVVTRLDNVLYDAFMAKFHEAKSVAEAAGGTLSQSSFLRKLIEDACLA